MSDNITIPASGVTVGSKDVSGVQVQRVALTVGGVGVANDVVGGPGAAAAGVIRTVSATDDPVVTALAALATAAQVGEVQANPTANTVLGRLKDLLIKQPALGTAGSPSSDVITVQGIASGTPMRESSSAETSTVYNGSTALTPKFAVISASSSGSNSIIAAVTSKKIRVLAVDIIANGTVNAKWRSSTATDITGLAYLVANSGYVRPFSPVGWFETAAGAALTLDLSAAVAVGGCVVYVEV
jgi:hypothetical protein